MATLGALFIQYLLGMYVNLFVTLPEPPNVRYPVIGDHIFLGFILGVLAIVTLVFAALSKRGNIIVTGAIGFLGILAAGLGGIFFLGGNSNNNTYSYIMAIFFIVAAIVYMEMAQLLRMKNFKVSMVESSVTVTPIK